RYAMPPQNQEAQWTSWQDSHWERPHGCDSRMISKNNGVGSTRRLRITRGRFLPATCTSIIFSNVELRFRKKWREWMKRSRKSWQPCCGLPRLVEVAFATHPCEPSPAIGNGQFICAQNGPARRCLEFPGRRGTLWFVGIQDSLTRVAP